MCCPTSKPEPTYNPEDLLPNEFSCGHSDVSDRIVGGQNASLGAHPWIAVLGYDVRGKIIELKNRI